MNQQFSNDEPYSWRRAPRPLPPEPDGIEMHALFAALWRAKWVIFGAVVLAVGLAAAVLSTVRPSYYSYVEVLLDTRQERVVGIEQVISDLNVTNSVVAGEIAVMRSNLLLGQVVDDLGLMQHPEFDPYAAASPSLLQRISTAMFGTEAAEPMPDINGDIETGLSEQDARNIVIWQVRRNLSVYQSGISYVISISMQAHDPDIAAAIANAVAERYIQDQLGAKLAATQRAIAFLDNRLIELETQLRDAEDAVVEFLAQQVLEEGGDEASVAQQLAEMNRAIVAARNDRAAAEARLAHVERLIAEGGPDMAAASLVTPRLASLDTALADLERQRAQLATRLGPRHPEMLALQLAIDEVLRDRRTAIRAGISELEAAVAQALGRERAIRQDIETAQLLQVDLSRSSVRLSQMERSASAMRQVYESFLARFQETTQQLEFQRPDARVITEAQPALAPARPRTKLILAVAVMLGAILGIVAVLVREALDRSVRTAQDVSRATGLPVLCTLPKVAFRGKGIAWQREQLWQTEISGYAEGLRLLRFGLMGATKGAAPRVVMLTGADWGVGTSSTVLGLARVIAASGQEVVIVDANFRHPQQAQFLGQQPSGLGIGAYLDGAADVADITLTEIEPGLSLVPAESNTGPTADVLADPRFRTLLQELAGQYDVVLIDAPPATGLSDAAILADLATAIIVVARARWSDHASVVAAIDAMEVAGGAVVGTVLSHADGQTSTSAAMAPQRLHVWETDRHARAG